MASREDVLNDFTVEEEMSPTILKAYLQRYPEFAQDLLALFNELSMSDLQSAEGSLPLETKSVSAGMGFGKHGVVAIDFEGGAVGAVAWKA